LRGQAEKFRKISSKQPPDSGVYATVSTIPRPAFDNRQIVNGILWRIRTGAPWRDLPAKCGKWMTVYQRFRRWSEAGIWEAVATILAQAMADNSRHSLDSTTVRGHVSAAGAKGGLANKLFGRSRGGFTCKVHCLSDARGIPHVFHPTPGEAADSTLRDN
jgi:transposase